MTVWGTGIMMAPILGPTVGGYIADNWSWRWIFYINLPIGILAFFMVSAFLFDASFHRRPRRVDLIGIVLMVVGFGSLQLMLDLGERRDWFDSNLILALSALAVAMLLGFVIRELLAPEPILDLTVFADRNFAASTAGRGADRCRAGGHGGDAPCGRHRGDRWRRRRKRYGIATAVPVRRIHRGVQCQPLAHHEFGRAVVQRDSRCGLSSDPNRDRRRTCRLSVDARDRVGHERSDGSCLHHARRIDSALE